MMFLLSNWKIIAMVAIAATSFGLGYKLANDMQRIKYGKALAKQQQEFKQLDSYRQSRAKALEQSLSEARNNNEIEYVEREKIVQKPVYVDCIIDHDGVRSITARITNYNTTRERAYTSGDDSANGGR